MFEKLNPVEQAKAEKHLRNKITSRFETNIKGALINERNLPLMLDREIITDEFKKYLLDKDGNCILKLVTKYDETIIYTTYPVGKMESIMEEEIDTYFKEWVHQPVTEKLLNWYEELQLETKHFYKTDFENYVDFQLRMKNLKRLKYYLDDERKDRIYIKWLTEPATDKQKNSITKNMLRFSGGKKKVNNKLLQILTKQDAGHLIEIILEQYGTYEEKLDKMNDCLDTYSRRYFKKPYKK